MAAVVGCSSSGLEQAEQTTGDTVVVAVAAEDSADTDTAPAADRTNWAAAAALPSVEVGNTDLDDRLADRAVPRRLERHPKREEEAAAPFPVEEGGIAVSCWWDHPWF